MSKVLRERLNEAQGRAGISWAELGRRSGYAERYIRGISLGTKSGNMTVSSVYCVAKALGVKPAWLAGWED
jgi:transcriptional regulator with XRE-family HTH domain